MRLLLFFNTLLGVLFFHQVYASGDPIPSGARSWGLANASVTFTDGWSLWNNIGGLSHAKSIEVLAAYDIRYGMSGLQSMAVGYVRPLHYGVMGISITHLGDQLYNENVLGVSYSYLWQKISIGAKLSYLQAGMAEAGTRRCVLVEIGTVAQLLPELSLGVHIYNVSQSRLDAATKERIPTIMKAGISYQPHTKVTWVVEVEKDIDFPAVFKTGLEYEIVKSLWFRTGVSTRPSSYSFGIGFSPKKLQMDYSLQTHPTLGLSHHLSLSIRLKKKKSTDETSSKN